jgi:hypothetical protein
MHIAVKDVPAFFAGFRIAAAGEGRHALSKRGLGQPANRPMGWGWEKQAPLPIAGVVCRARAIVS